MQRKKKKKLLRKVQNQQIKVKLGYESNPNFFCLFIFIVGLIHTKMAKYRISEFNVKKFFGFLGTNERPNDINYIIDNDPVLKKLDKEIGDLNDKAAAYLKKDADAVKILKKYGIDLK